MAREAHMARGIQGYGSHRREHDEESGSAVEAGPAKERAGARDGRAKAEREAMGDLPVASPTSRGVPSR